MILNTVFSPVFDIQRLISVPWIVYSGGHDLRSQQEIVPVKDIVGAVTEHLNQLFDGERATCSTHRRCLRRLLTFMNSAAIGIFEPVETIMHP